MSRRGAGWIEDGGGQLDLRADVASWFEFNDSIDQSADEIELWLKLTE
jgi:hypothetical protein